VKRLFNVLLLGLPVALVLRLRGGSETAIFAGAGLSLLPLALAIGDGTEELAKRAGTAVGGFLNATFGNAAELIIAIFALKKGLPQLVKASITGSIIGNTLLSLGVSSFLGGIRHGSQAFAVKPAGRHAAMMILAVSAIGLPAVFASVQPDEFAREEVSIGVSLVLLLTYGAYLGYSFFARRPRERLVPIAEPAKWSLGRSLAVLAGSVVGTAISAELLVGAVESFSKSLGLSPAFLGLILVPLIGNLAEYTSAARFALANRMDLAMSIAANSSTQIAVFVAPLLVLVGLLFHPMNLVFRPMELATLFASSAIFAYISLDGESNWLEGVQLLALYAIAAVAFFFLPG
jgi:Ca2+:H+ antiporter